jgi:uncharacterized protein (DUF305 family)
MVLLSRSFVRKRMISLATTMSVAATSFALADDPAKTDQVRGRMAIPIRHVADRTDHSGEQSFLSESAVAMNKMMADMKVKPIGDVDRDFVAMMLPHHQGAVDMAKAELEYGHNEQLRRLAHEIVATQEREITVMRDFVSAHLPTQPAPMDDSAAHSGMKMSQ